MRKSNKKLHNRKKIYLKIAFHFTILQKTCQLRTVRQECIDKKFFKKMTEKEPSLFGHFLE